MPDPPLGELELEVLRHISEHAPATVGEVAEHFASARGLARTTLLTVMERLRRKGYLTRKKAGGPYRYSPTTPKQDVLRSVVREFVARALGGSSQPFVAYLSEEADLTEPEIADLRRLVRTLGKKRKGGAR